MLAKTLIRKNTITAILAEGSEGLDFIGVINALAFLGYDIEYGELKKPLIVINALENFYSLEKALSQGASICGADAKNLQQVSLYATLEDLKSLEKGSLACENLIIWDCRKVGEKLGIELKQFFSTFLQPRKNFRFLLWITEEQWQEHGNDFDLSLILSRGSENQIQYTEHALKPLLMPEVMVSRNYKSYYNPALALYEGYGY